MCGRFTLHRPKPEIIKELQPELWEDEDRYEPMYNIAPTMDCLVLTAVNGARRLSFMRWGLIPSWARDAAIGSRLINARCETVTEKPSFRHLVGRTNCAVVMDGYIEWQRRGGRKQPHLIRHRDHGLMLAAGLWDTWTTPEGLALRTFTIITADAAPGILEIHDRMPAILPRDGVDDWLNPAGPAARQVLGTFQGELDVAAISTAANNVRNNAPEILLPPPEQLDLGL